MNVTFMGDSKTNANQFQKQLLHDLSAAEMPLQLAQDGWHVAELEAATDAWIAGAEGVPEIVFINIGINDVSHATEQAVFEAKLGSILDKLHAEWPDALVYVMRVWRRGADAECDAMDDIWIPNVLATRNTFAFVGGDERICLKGNDEGAIETVMDGAHPSGIGHYLIAKASEAAII